MKLRLMSSRFQTKAMPLLRLFGQPTESKLFQGILLNNYDCLRENRQGQEPPEVSVRESRSGEVSIKVKVQSLTGATATIVQRVSPGFTLFIDPDEQEVISVYGLGRTVITLPSSEVAQIPLSNNRRKILEKKHKNYKFATRREAQEFAHSLLRMNITASIEIHQMKLFEYNPTSRTLSQTHDAQRIEGGRDTMFLHLLRTHEGRQKMFLTRHLPKDKVNPREEKYGALVYVNRATSLLLDEETNSFSCRFEGIRIRNQPGCIGFKRDSADSDNYDSGGGDVMELTLWSAQDRKKLEVFVKQGKGKSSKALVPFKPLFGPRPLAIQYETAHELPGSVPNTLRFTSPAALSSSSLNSTILADARIIQVMTDPTPVG